MHNVDPESVAPLSTLQDIDVGSVVETHGVVHEQNGEFYLVEVDTDFSAERLPVALQLVDPPEELIAGAYMLVEGRLSVSDDTAAFGLATLSVMNFDMFEPELDEHATETSQSKAHDAVRDILEEYTNPVPHRFVVETAVSRGIDRNAVSEMLDRMVSASNVYSPTTGLVGLV